MYVCLFMYVCMCVYMYVCLCVCVYVCSNIETYIVKSNNILYVCTYVCMYAKRKRASEKEREKSHIQLKKHRQRENGTSTKKKQRKTCRVCRRHLNVLSKSQKNLRTVLQDLYTVHVIITCPKRVAVCGNVTAAARLLQQECVAL